MKRLALIAALLVASPALAQSAPPAPDTKPATSPAAEAWQRYSDTMRDLHRQFMASPWAQLPEQRAQGLYLLQAMEVMGFNTYVAPRQDYPALKVSYPPLELSWGMTNPDFFYRTGFVDGARTYRVYGKLNGVRWATMQVMDGFMGDETMNTIGNVDFDDLKIGPDGSFEFFLGANPPADAGGRTWVKLDPAKHNHQLTVRETHYDWEKEGPMEIHIDTLDRPISSPIFPSEEDLARRIDRMAKWSKGAFAFTMMTANVYLPGADGKPPREANRFYGSADGRSQGGNPLGYWVGMLYDIQPDEALVIEMPVIPARYWGFQLGTVFSQTTDFSYHKSSINMAQARIDGDGRFRAVLSLKDPGVPNWLDAVGLAKGTALLRFYKAEGDAHIVPTVTKMKLADVRRALPKDTPVVTPGQRKAELARIQASSLRRFGL